MLKPFFYWQNKVLRSVKPEEVVCLVAEKNYTKIYLSNESYCLVRSTLTGAMKYLPPDIFIKIHRSCVVSIHHIDRIARDHLTIGEESFPIGRYYYRALMQKLTIIE